MCRQLRYIFFGCKYNGNSNKGPIVLVLNNKLIKPVTLISHKISSISGIHNCLYQSFTYCLN